jgi:deoxyadenosine/deoxycytidine kinase
MLERTVYFSGPSGTGKTHLIAELIRYNPLYICGNPDKLDRVNHLRDKAYSEKKYSRTFQYGLGKIEERVREARNHRELESLNPDKIILGDRCMHDTIAYINAALRYGDLDEEEAEVLLGANKESYNPEILPKHIILVSFSFEEIKRYLRERWKTEGVGFREDDDRYLKIVSRCFDEHFGGLELLRRISCPQEIDVKNLDILIRQAVLTG